MKPRKKLRILEDTVMAKKVVPVSIEEKLDLNENDLPIEDLDEEYEEEGRRAINYKIAKNKGLTPKRSKLQRNPRVKHRVKFEKAKVRRKGQVRTVRTEVKKYSGEISGINARVKKGIKLA
ncbi:UTP3 [Lepeophtheirus salmonis]|nr:UTP3 [Lepeophtheirus salmonis]CAF2770439.1 UTP3 [Lepeophtheirus salmonis]